MPVTGRKPKPAGQRRNHHAPTHEWVEVVNVPFAGKPPVGLPATRTVLLEDGPADIKLHAQTKAWWRRIARMPHCRLWSESDWEFALATALVADALFYGRTTAATELRQREKVLGTTVDARRDLRIRYVEAGEVDGDDAEVTHLDAYRDL